MRIISIVFLLFSLLSADVHLKIDGFSNRYDAVADDLDTLKGEFAESQRRQL